MISKAPHVLLVNPWIVDFAAYDFWIKPLGLLLIGGLLRENGYKVSLVDCLDRNDPHLSQLREIKCSQNRDDGTGHFYKESIPKPEIVKEIPRYYSRYGTPISIVKQILDQSIPPEIIMITSMMTYWYPGVIEMVSLLKEIFPNVKIILGGVYATLYPDHARQYSGADHIIVGPGEIQALKIADSITGLLSDYSVYNRIDDYPGPAYDLYHRLDSVAILTSRGCPYRCPFCASHLLYPKFEQREPGKVVNEITWLTKKFGVRHFAFYDDALLINKQNHLIPILEGVLQNELKVNFHLPNGIHPGLVDRHLARLMFQTGFKTIRLSYETSSPVRQKAMGMKVSNQDLIQAVESLVHAGYHREDLASYIIMGLPEQTMEEIINSMEFVLNVGIKINLASFSPIPGTQSWKEAVNSKELAANVDPLLTNNSIFPLKSKFLDYYDFMQMSTLSKSINRIINYHKRYD